MSKPLVTVICICYNHELYVQQAILSVLNQTYKNIELIVVNNGSKDNSFEKIQTIVNQFPFIKFIDFKEVLSNTIAFNKAFDKANGLYLIDLAADDILLPNCIENQVAFFLKQNENVGLIFGNAYHINENGSRFKPYFEVDQNNKVLDKSLFTTTYEKVLAGGLCMCSVSAMFTTKHFKELGGYNEDLFFEDLDYWLRLSHRFEIKFLDEFLVEKRFIQNSLGNQFYGSNDFAKKITESVIKIFSESIDRNTKKSEFDALLKRIHYSIDKSIKNKQWNYLSKFIGLELKSRFYKNFK